MPLSLVAVWASIMLTRTTVFVNELSPVVRQPQVQEALADGVVTGVLGAAHPAARGRAGARGSAAPGGRAPSSPTLASPPPGPARSAAPTGSSSAVLEGRADTGLDSQGRVTMIIPLELPELEQVLTQVGVTDPAALRPTIEIPLVAASDLATAKRVYAVADAWGVWAPVLVVALALLAVALAQRRTGRPRVDRVRLAARRA